MTTPTPTPTAAPREMKMSAEHTPGPWEYLPAFVSGWRVDSDGEGGALIVADVRMLADAALIASAPDMLKALRAISVAYASNGNTKRQKAAFAEVRAAIAKATGATP